MKLLKDLGLLLATNKSKEKKRYGLYECPDCKKSFKSSTCNVDRGLSTRCRDCGYKKTAKINKTHGKSSEPTYKVWLSMKQRCLNPKNKRYSDYGGRGITVCDEWGSSYSSFHVWLVNNGYGVGLSIDRIDNDKGYNPDNCRVVDGSVQGANRRKLKNGSTAYIGVSFLTSCPIRPYRASLAWRGKKIMLGNYRTANEAAEARDGYILKHNLPHTLNQAVNHGS